MCLASCGCGTDRQQAQQQGIQGHKQGIARPTWPPGLCCRLSRSIRRRGWLSSQPWLRWLRTHKWETVAGLVEALRSKHPLCESALPRVPAEHRGPPASRSNGFAATLAAGQCSQAGHDTAQSLSLSWHICLSLANTSINIISLLGFLISSSITASLRLPPSALPCNLSIRLVPASPGQKEAPSCRLPFTVQMLSMCFLHHVHAVSSSLQPWLLVAWQITVTILQRQWSRTKFCPSWYVCVLKGSSHRPCRAT